MRYFDNPNDPKQDELIQLAYDTVHAILTQWEEKKLPGDFFHTPMDLYETLSFFSYGLPKPTDKIGSALDYNHAQYLEDCQRKD